MSKKKNRVRFDLSPFLIHFVRTMVIDRDDAPEVPEHWGWGNINEDVEFTPFFLLRCVLRHRRVWATWSYRGGKRTIYGPRPAVCMTEMPLAAFVQSSRARSKRGEKISPYGLVIPKDQAFRAGARPVIYGLSGSPRSRTDEGGSRMLPSSALPTREQYRYVAYNPSYDRGPDWTHEREWRWPGPPPGAPDPDGLPPSTWANIDGLQLDKSGFTGMGLIVRTPRQARLLVHDILRLVDQEALDEEAFQFILTLDQLPPMEKLLLPKEVSAAVQSNLVDLSPFFSIPQNSDALVRRLDHLISEAATAADATLGERGGCWLWLLDNTHPLVRALLHRAPSRIHVSQVGRYLVHLPELGSGNLAHRQSLVTRLATEVEKEFDLRATYFSILGSSDPDATPFYNGFVDDKRVFWNESFHSEDY
jgi:hypothetical protein